MKNTKGLLLYVVSEDWYFLSHRAELAAAARDDGWRVIVLANVAAGRQQIEDLGFELHHWGLDRGALKLSNLLAAWRVMRDLIAKVRPTLVHVVSLEASIIARLALIGHGRVGFLATWGGLGRLRPKSRVSVAITRALAPWLCWIFIYGARRGLVVQNRDDLELVAPSWLKLRLGVTLIPGSGVNTELFVSAPHPHNGELKVALVSRMIRDKGIFEFIEAIRSLNAEGLKVKGLLVGKPDDGNPGSISGAEILSSVEGSGVEWLGFRADIPDLIQGVDVVCLPTSYGEGIPRALLEAGAVGRPVISSDVPGPRDLVRDGVDGLLVEPRNPDALNKAISTLAQSRRRRQAMGNSFRTRVTRLFSNDRILSSYLTKYEELAGPES